MFEMNLTEQQQGAFLGLFNQLIMADGNISVVEREKWNTFASEFPGIKLKIYPSEQLETVFPDKCSRASAMLELISVGLAKENIEDEDKAFLEETAASLKISKETFAQMWSWVKKMTELAIESQKFMEGN